MDGDDVAKDLSIRTEPQILRTPVSVRKQRRESWIYEKPDSLGLPEVNVPYAPTKNLETQVESPRGADKECFPSNSFDGLKPNVQLHSEAGLGFNTERLPSQEVSRLPFQDRPGEKSSEAAAYGNPAELESESLLGNEPAFEDLPDSSEDVPILTPTEDGAGRNAWVLKTSSAAAGSKTGLASVGVDQRLIPAKDESALMPISPRKDSSVLSKVFRKILRFILIVLDLQARPEHVEALRQMEPWSLTIKDPKLVRLMPILWHIISYGLTQTSFFFRDNRKQFFVSDTSSRRACFTLQFLRWFWLLKFSS
jgi:hypothetical protein